MPQHKQLIILSELLDSCWADRAPGPHWPTEASMVALPSGVNVLPLRVKDWGLSLGFRLLEAIVPAAPSCPVSQ